MTILDGLKLQLWDITERAANAELEVLTARLQSHAWSPDRQRLATVSRDGVVRVWSAELTGESLALRPQELFAPGGLATTVKFSPDGLRFLTASPGTAMIWKLEPVAVPDGAGPIYVFLRGRSARGVVPGEPDTAPLTVE